MGRWSGSGGYLLIADPGAPGGRIERDTAQCVHCMAHWAVDPGSGTPRGWCVNCSGPTCGRAPCNACVPFLKKIEEQEQRQALRDALMERMGLR